MKEEKIFTQTVFASKLHFECTLRLHELLQSVLRSILVWAIKTSAFGSPRVMIKDTHTYTHTMPSQFHNLQWSSQVPVNCTSKVSLGKPVYQTWGQDMLAGWPLSTSCAVCHQVDCSQGSNSSCTQPSKVISLQRTGQGKSHFACACWMKVYKEKMSVYMQICTFFEALQKQNWCF